MGGQHSKKVHQISVKFPHPIWRKIEKEAQARNEVPSEFIRQTVIVRVADVPLTSEDARIIAERIEKAEREGRML